MSMGSRDADRQSARSSGMSGSSDTGSQMQDAAEQAKQKAADVAEQAKQTTTTRANDQKDKAADSLGSVARAFGDVGDQLRDQNPTMAHYADMASEKIEQFAGQLSSRDVTDLLSDVEDIARRNPAVFLGGAFALGVVGARFMKSSRPSSSQRDRDMMRYSGPGTYHTADTRYKGYTGRDATPPRTSYRTAGYRQPTSPAYYSPEDSTSRTRETGRDAYGNADSSMTTDTMQPGTGEDRYGTR